MSRKVKKSVAIPIIIATALVAGGGIWAYNNHNKQVLPKLTSTNIQPQDNSNDNSEKKDKNQDNTTSDTRNNNGTSPNHTPKQYETPKGTTPPQKSSMITGVVNYKNVSGNTLTIRNTIDQRLSSGTCKLTLTNQATNKVVTKNADVVTNPSSSTCKGFTVDNLQKGTWNIVISINSGDRTGKITSNVTL